MQHTPIGKPPGLLQIYAKIVSGIEVSSIEQNVGVLRLADLGVERASRGPIDLGGDAAFHEVSTSAAAVAGVALLHILGAHGQGARYRREVEDKLSSPTPRRELKHAAATSTREKHLVAGDA